MKAPHFCIVMLTLTALCPTLAQADVRPKKDSSTAVITKEPSASDSLLITPGTQNDGDKRQAETEDRFHPRTHLRLGAVLSPQINFAGGLDFPLAHVSLSRDFAGRLDIEALLVNFKDKPSNFLGPGTATGTSLYIPFTLNQVYVGGLRKGGKVYGGFGLGVVADINIFVERPGSFTGKLFVGAQINARSSAELGVNFIGKDAIATLQVRLGL